MRTLTGMGGLGNAQELAELLRQMGRGPDSMLAHITPEEAQMLLESGGSGRMNPQTGLPEFQPVYDDRTGMFYDDAGTAMEDIPDYSFAPSRKPDEIAENIRGMEPDQFERFTGQQPMFTGEGSLAPPSYQSAQTFDIGFGPGQFQPAMPQTQGLELSPTRGVLGMAPDQFQRFTADDQAQPAGMGDRLRGLETGYREFRREYPMLERLLTTGAASLPAILQARRARREGRGAESELREMAAPIREQAEALRQQALSGGLTPQQARQQEARRASLRQSASQRGGTTGTQQAMIENTLTRERAGLAQTNLENAMRQLNLANTLTEAAIRARLASDRNVNQSLQNIYTNLIRTASGTNTTGQTQPPSQPEQLLQNEPLVPRPTTAGGK
jgi:hypothetical protein